MGDDEVRPRHPADGGVASSAGEHLVWHQELICPGEPCRGRVRRFPPGELIDDGRAERRRCPVCGTSTTAPAFYLLRGERGLEPPAGRAPTDELRGPERCETAGPGDPVL